MRIPNIWEKKTCSKPQTSYESIWYSWYAKKWHSGSPECSPLAQQLTEITEPPSAPRFGMPVPEIRARHRLATGPIIPGFNMAISNLRATEGQRALHAHFWSQRALGFAMIWTPKIIHLPYTLWCHQTWRAGKWIIEISDFPHNIDISIQFGGFSIAMFEC